MFFSGGDNAMVRYLTQLGLERKAKPVPTQRAYIAAKAAEKPANS